MAGSDFTIENADPMIRKVFSTLSLAVEPAFSSHKHSHLNCQCDLAVSDPLFLSHLPLVFLVDSTRFDFDLINYNDDWLARALTAIRSRVDCSADVNWNEKYAKINRNLKLKMKWEKKVCTAVTKGSWMSHINTVPIDNESGFIIFGLFCSLAQ